MKVTRAIREFIEQQIEMKEKQALEPFLKKKEDALKRVNEESENLKAEMNSMLQPVLDKYNIKKKLNVSIPNLEYYLPEVNKYNEKRDEFYNKRKSFVVDIIAEMELGGTKAELMELINSIQF